MKFNVYILLLSQAKWYVGTTRKSPEARFKEHVGKGGAAWCKRFPPIRIVSTQRCTSELDMLVQEKLTTFEMMKEKGYEQVRGANFCQLKPLNLEHLAWDMAQITGDNARLLIKNLQPNGPMKNKYGHLVKDVPTKPKGTSKYFYT